MSRDWTFFLEDILDCALQVATYTKGMKLEEFCTNRLVFDAVLRNLEIIGEAAKNLPDVATAAMPEIEWSKAAGFRDVIAHQYFGVDANIVWDVVTNKMPVIIESTTELLEKVRHKKL